MKVEKQFLVEGKCYLLKLDADGTEHRLPWRGEWPDDGEVVEIERDKDGTLIETTRLSDHPNVPPPIGAGWVHVRLDLPPCDDPHVKDMEFWQYRRPLVVR